MPGNEPGDRVHNFFAQDHLFQGQQQSQVAEDRREYNYSSPFKHGPIVGPPDFAKGPNELQPKMNSFGFSSQFHQSGQNEENFLAMGISSSGLPFHGLQQSVPDHFTNSSVPLETPVSAVSFDFFGGPQHTSYQQSTMPQFLQPQPSGTDDVQAIHQELVMRRQQELQGHHFDSRQNHSVNQSTLVNGDTRADMFQHSSSAEDAPNWIYQGSPNMTGSSTGLSGYQPNISQTQQFNHSVYGVPSSSSRCLSLADDSHVLPNPSLIPQSQMLVSDNYYNGNQHELLTDQVHMEDESLSSRHNLHSRNVLEVASKQSLNMGTKNRGDIHLSNFMPRDSTEDFSQGKQELTFHLETSYRKSNGQIASPKNEVALDPEEKKILFSSDDNFWDAFGTAPCIGQESGNILCDGGLLNSLPSIQSGIWSALMQSAAAETSGNVTPKEFGLSFQSNNGPAGGEQHPLVGNNTGEKGTSSAEHNVHKLFSTFDSVSFPPNYVKNATTSGLNQIPSTFHQEPGRNLQIETSYNFDQSLEDSHKHFNSNLLQTSAASLNPNQAGLYTETQIPSGQTGTRLQSDGWKTLAVMPPTADKLNNHDAEKLKQSSHVSMMQGGISSLWKQNRAIGHDIESGREKSGHGNRINDSEAQSHNPAKTVNANSFVQNNSLFNQWRSPHPPASSQEGKNSQRLQNQVQNPNLVLGSMNSSDGDKIDSCEIEKYDGKENPGERHHSSLNQHLSVGNREGGSFNEFDPQSRRQNSINHLPVKVSTSPKFRYHPMGNADDNVVTGHNFQQPAQAQATSLQNPVFGHSNLFGQVAMNSTVPKKGHSFELLGDAKDAENNSSFSSSQNMLELLNKVSQEKDRTAMTQTMSFEGNTENQSTEAENSHRDHHHQRVQSSVQQGFGLHLGPPLQRSQLSQNSQGRKTNSPYQMPRNISSAFFSGIPNSKDHLQSHQLMMPREKSINKLNEPFSLKVSSAAQRGSSDTLLPDASPRAMPEKDRMNDFCEGLATATMPMGNLGESSQHDSQHPATMMHNIRTDVPMYHSSGQHQLLRSQIQPSPYQNILESSSTRSTEDVEDNRLKESTNCQSESENTDRVPEVKGSVGKEQAMRNHFKNSPANSTSMLEKIQDIGQSLRPSSFSDQPHSLPNQIQALRNADIRVINRASKTMEGPKSLADAPITSLKAGQQGEHNAAVEGSIRSTTTVAREDSKIVSFPGLVDIVPRNVSQHGNIASRDRSVLGSTVSQSNSYSDHAASARVEYDKGNQQMAPPWYSSYESFKNGQVLQINDANKVSHTTRSGEHPFTLTKSTCGSNALNSDEKGTSVPLVIDSSSPTSAVDDHCSPKLPQLNVTGQHSVHLGYKKRKNDTFGLKPWHKEISDDSYYHWAHSTTEADGSKAVKRVPGKVDDIAEPREDDASSVIRSKRRLITSSHHMQQLIGPLPATTLSADALSAYDVAAYSLSRIALGDACRAISFASNSLKTPLEKHNAARELTDRARTIKGKLRRLEKRASSLLDLRTECQDVDKCSLRNRFAMHYLEQTDNAETASINTSTMKPPTQRYAMAAPVTEIIPNDVKCLSL